jgi:purine-binding chemotaxis protein CheW
VVVGSLIARCGDTILALPLDRVVEVFRMAAVSARLPRVPRECLGVLDCRGQLVPLIDLAARLGLCAPRKITALVDGQVVTVEEPLGRVGYAVDGVSELTDEPVESLTAETSPLFGKLVCGAVRARQGQLAPLIDPTLLLTVRARYQIRLAVEALANTGSAATGSA